MKTGERLQRRRESLGLSRRQAAELIGIKQAYLQKLETGVNNPPAWALLPLFADVYGTTIDSFFGRDDESNYDESSETKKELFGKVAQLTDHQKLLLSLMIDQMALAANVIHSE